MSDREIFQFNLCQLFESSGRSQVELAEYVGVRKSTVSGWVHGASYPRADAMEKIALFFSVNLSRLVELNASTPRNSSLSPDEKRLVDLYRSAEPAAQKIVITVLETSQRKDTSDKAI